MPFSQYIYKLYGAQWREIFKAGGDLMDAVHNGGKAAQVGSTREMTDGKYIKACGDGRLGKWRENTTCATRGIITKYATTL